MTNVTTALQLGTAIHQHFLSCHILMQQHMPGSLFCWFGSTTLKAWLLYAV